MLKQDIFQAEESQDNVVRLTPDILDKIEATIRRFVWLKHESQYRTISLYVLYTHVADVFENAPKLLLYGPTQGCGKTTTLKIVSKLIRQPAYCETLPTAAMTGRDIDLNKTIPIWDEADKYLRAGSNKTDLLTIANDMWTRGGVFRRLVKGR